MTIRTRSVEYRHGDVLLDGMLAFEDSMEGRRPGVLVSHAWGGRGEFEDGKARLLAELGYAGFALDLYGKDRRGGSRDENRALMKPFLDDRGMLSARLGAALEAIRSQPEVDASRIAAIGFCFGGLCVLDLARSGANLAGVVSFHGLFAPPGEGADRPIRARILALHGWDDPMVPPDAVEGLARELTGRGADWQIHAYGGVMHAFTNPSANDPSFGTVYNAVADRRSWAAMCDFLAEVFGRPGLA